MKVLVIRFSSIGDIVLTTPVVRCLKKQLPGVELHYLTKSSFKTIVENNPYIDKGHYLEEDINTTIEELKAEQFDFVVDLHHNLRTARVKQALEVKAASFPKMNVEKWVLVNLKMNMMPNESIVERYFETVKPLGVQNDGQGLDYFIPEDDQVTDKDIPVSHWAGYVACVIGGSYNTKKFPVAKWQEFCEKVPFPVILLGDMGDREQGALIAEQDKVKIYNACGKFNLNESADLVKKSRIVVSNDTGLMHVAAAFKKPLVSLWGNTSPELGMFPYYGSNDLKERIAPQSFILENKHLYCHPCSKLGYKKCPKRHFKCMNDLNVDNIVDIIKKNW